MSTNGHQPERPSTPDEQCSICLHDLDNKCCSNSCLHLFCFECLKRWSNTESTCPICRKVFIQIYHTFTEQGIHETYNVPEDTNNSSRRIRTRLDDIVEQILDALIYSRGVRIVYSDNISSRSTLLLISANEEDQISNRYETIVPSFDVETIAFNPIETPNSSSMAQPSTSTGIQDSLDRQNNRYNLRSRILVSPTVNESFSISVYVSRIAPGERSSPNLDSSSDEESTTYSSSSDEESTTYSSSSDEESTTDSSSSDEESTTDSSSSDEESTTDSQTQARMNSRDVNNKNKTKTKDL